MEDRWDETLSIAEQNLLSAIFGADSFDEIKVECHHRVTFTNGNGKTMCIDCDKEIK